MIRLALRCRSSDAEPVLAELLELAPSGIEEISEPDGQADVIEYAVYGAPGELPELGALEALAGKSSIEIRSSEVPEDWEERWKRFYFPVLVAGRLYVRPPWEERAQRGGVEEIVIDPGRAFGTGTHPTTRMCLELLLEASPAGARRLAEAGLARAIGRERPRSLCDLGCGSGVLAIAAAKLGFEPVLAVDADRVAILECRRNARANGVELELRHADLRRGAAPVADVVSANLTASLLKAVAAGWQDSGKRPGMAIVSGLLRPEADEVSEALGRVGLRERQRLVAGDWAALMLIRGF